MDRRRSSHIVPEIYEATINPSHWNYVLAMIAKLTKSRSACLYYKNTDLGFADAFAHYGLSVEMSLDIEHQIERIDSILSGGFASSDTPSCYQYYPGNDEALSEDSTLFKNWMKPNDIYYIGGARFIDAPTHRASLASNIGPAKHPMRT